MVRCRLLIAIALSVVSCCVAAQSASSPSALNVAPSSSGVLAEVHRLHYSGQSAAALQKADAYLANRPNDVPMRFMKGVILADQRRGAEAIQIFQKLVDDYPDLPEPYNNLAALYAAGGDYGRARVTLEEAVRANPGYAIAHENLGDVYAALASQSYARARQLDPSNAALDTKLTLVRDLFKRKADAPTAASAPASGATASK
jgi:tetratricopeptide (TPR) repeat protein